MNHIGCHSLGFAILLILPHHRSVLSTRTTFAKLWPYLMASKLLQFTAFCLWMLRENAIWRITSRRLQHKTLFLLHYSQSFRTLQRNSPEVMVLCLRRAIKFGRWFFYMLCRPSIVVQAESFIKTWWFLFCITKAIHLISQYFLSYYRHILIRLILGDAAIYKIRVAKMHGFVNSSLNSFYLFWRHFF